MNFLLAKPSGLIVEKMKKLVEALGSTPLPLKSLNEIKSYNTTEIEAIVVSTALSSPVKETFTQVINQCWKTLGNKPTFLASYADLRRTKIIASAKFQSCGMDVNLLGVSEVMDERAQPVKNPIFIITHDEIANPASFPVVLVALKRILKRSQELPFEQPN